jgi:hypothetical protein
MKKLFITTTLLISSFSLFATIRTVSNNPATIAQYSTIQAAIDASSSGDTVYVQGSPNTYNVFTISNKQLVIIGPGYSPQKDFGYYALINTNGGRCYILGAASSGTEIQGLTFDHGISIGNASINNLRFIRNRFSNISYGSVIFIGPYSTSTIVSGYIFEGNWFDNTYVQASPWTYLFLQNFIFHNNIFYDNTSGCCPTGSIDGFYNCVNVLFDHNLWYGPSGSARECFTNSCSGINLSNNIFVKRDPAINLSLSNFTNNITFNAGNNTPWSMNGNIDVGGNVANTDPQMVSQASVNNGVNNPLLDFTILAGPANNSGSDGKDMGLLYDVVGSLNWANTRNSRLPRIFTMNISNPTVQTGATITVSVVAKTSN